MTSLKFQELNPFPELLHGFTLRKPNADSDLIPAENILSLLDHSPSQLVQAEQPHGSSIMAVTQSQRGCTIPDVDGLITTSPNILLVIRTADCGALFLYDPEHRAVGLAHSGKKGTEANITQNIVAEMVCKYGTNPKNLIAILGPCIRPPHYETDFAVQIAEQAYHAGIREFKDCGENTASDLKRYYSYRLEKGRTGRHYAFIGITPK